MRCDNKRLLMSIFELTESYIYGLDVLNQRVTKKRLVEKCGYRKHYEELRDYLMDRGFDPCPGYGWRVPRKARKYIKVV